MDRFQTSSFKLIDKQQMKCLKLFKIKKIFPSNTNVYVSIQGIWKIARNISRSNSEPKKNRKKDINIDLEISRFRVITIFILKKL